MIKKKERDIWYICSFSLYNNVVSFSFSFFQISGKFSYEYLKYKDRNKL